MKLTTTQVQETIARARAAGQRPSFIDADLSGLDLSGLDLEGADFTSANLSGANLSGANLAKANLTGARMVDVTAEDVDFTGAIMRRANLTSANLMHSTAVDADLTDAAFRAADLFGVPFSGANLTGTDLRDAVDFETGALPGALMVEGLPHGGLAVIPTPGQWHVLLGAWTGTPEGLASADKGILSLDTDKARPILDGVHAMVQAHTTYYRPVIERLASQWG